MNEIRCAHCGDTDGPFADTGEHYLCESCTNRGAR